MVKEFGGLEKCDYFYSSKLGDLNFTKVFGENCCNVTIVLLSLNRIEHTLLLLKSLQEVFPQFDGEILIADNGSSTTELNELKRRIRNYSFKITIHEFGENLGVAKGRNKAFSLVKTEWIFSLDNDIFFVSNPFWEAEKVIMKTGAKFCNMPLLDREGKDYINNGGYLWFNQYEDGQYYISCGPIYQLERSKENTRFGFSLSNFLYGGCAFYHARTFCETEQFDENYFVGFEDIDYSLQLYRKGMEIANCNYASLVHNHPRNEVSTSYDKKRYQYDVLKKSAIYFEKKNKIKVWDINTDAFFKTESGKKVQDENVSLSEIYEVAKSNYRNISNAVVDNGSCNQANTRIELSEVYKMNEELKQMNSELRKWTEDCQQQNVNLNEANRELRTMNNELRKWTEDLQAENERLRNELEKKDKFIQGERRDENMVCDK